MREMLRGVWVVAILVLAFSVSYYYAFSDTSSRSSSELSPVSSMPAPDARTLFAPADAQDLEPSDSDSATATEPVPSSNQLVEAIAANGEGVGAFGTGVTVFVAPDMTPIHGADADPDVSLFSASDAGQVEVAAASGGVSLLDIRTTIPQSGSGGPQRVVYEAERPFSASTECKFCHPRQYQEWRTSPHSYSGISPTFYSLVAAGQNSFGVGALINVSQGVSIAGAAGNFCLPCHSPMGFVGLEGRFSGNNLGFSEVQPQFPFVCNLASPPGVALVTECTFENSAEVCGARGRCSQFEARTCINMPPVSEGTDFPRVRRHCFEDDDCSGSGSGCPGGEDCGPCIIAPSTIYYSPEAQEGINCESCHNILPNHRRACQQFRNSDSVGVLSIDLQERDLDGTRLRLGPYPVDQISNGQGILGDQISPRRNAFHESARVDTPLAINYEDTDWANGIRNPLNTDPEVVRPTSVTCDELPYCLAGFCEGGPSKGDPCGSGPEADVNCGGCSAAGTCGPGGIRAGQACRTTVDCATPTSETENLMTRAIADGTLGPLFAPDIGGGVRQLDRPDGNYYRSSMFCGTCHDVRPPFGNPVLRSCELQDTHVCSTDADCLDLNIGCPGVPEDCGPCLMENGSSPDVAGSPGSVTPDVGSPRNTGVRRVENLFTEWQISPYNHPELTFCDGNAFRACNNNTDCSDFGDGLCTVRSPNPTEVVTCQDCHMSLFPRVPLVADTNGDGTPDTVTPRNKLYAEDLAAIEGSQSDLSEPLPVRRVSTHYMPGVDLPLIPFAGQGTQEALRQEILDSTYKLDFDATPDTATEGASFDVELTIENVGVGHRLPSGFSHERQNWVQLYVQTSSSLEALDIVDNPFDPRAPCNMQGTIATGADQDVPGFRDRAGAARLGAAGCVYRSGFILDKAHPVTGEMEPDGSVDDEDPEDFFVVVGTRVRGETGDARIEVNPGAEGRALSIQYICEEATAEAYLEGVQEFSGIDLSTPSNFAHQVRFCDPNKSPQVPGEGPPGLGGGFTAPGFGNEDCMEMVMGELQDLGPCVPEIELSDANERGQCAHDLTRPSCQNDADCGDAGPCLYACSEFPELMCCDVEAAGTECEDFYSDIGSDECLIGFEDPGTPNRVCVGGDLLTEGTPCAVDTDCPGTGGECEDESDVSICIRGPNSGRGCTVARTDELCTAGFECGSVGECVVENRGIVNFQNQFRSTSNGVCVAATNPRDAENVPIPLLDSGAGITEPVGCLLNLSCTLEGLSGAVCLVNGQCAEDSNDGSGASHGDTCTNVTYREDCGTFNGNSIACNVERNVELNGRPSESVFIQNHPLNFNSLPPLEPRPFEYDFGIPAGLDGEVLIVTARVMNRHFPMRFLRNLIGTQVIRPPFLIEAQGDADNPNDCKDARTIDIDCYVKPVAILGNAEPGGYFPPEQTIVTKTVTVLAP